MLSLIVLMLFGLAVAFFAGQNTVPVTITLAQYQMRGIPLYVLIAGSLIVGFLISWIVSLVEGLGTSFRLYGKDSAIRDSQRTVSNLKERVHELEIENARLRGTHTERVVERADDEDRDVGYQPSWFDRFKHSLR